MPLGLVVRDKFIRYMFLKMLNAKKLFTPCRSAETVVVYIVRKVNMHAKPIGNSKHIRNQDFEIAYQAYRSMSSCFRGQLITNLRLVAVSRVALNADRPGK
jgi:hypothetical protein